MKGYRLPKKEFLLKFGEGTRYDGFECRVRSLSISAFLDLTSMASSKADGQAVASQTRAMLETLAANILSWNLEDEDGNPVKPSLDSLMEEDVAFGMDIILAWMEGMGGVPAPLPGGSQNGGPAPELSVPMEAL